MTASGMTDPREPAAGPSAPGAPDASATADRRRRRRRAIVRVAAILAAVVVGLLVAGLVWLGYPQPVLPEAAGALASTSSVTYADEGSWLSFTPTGADPTTGLIFYPGAKVPPEAYARSAQAIAERGFAVFIVPMPLNFAIFGVDRAADVIRAHPEIEHWAIGGHSLGGAMAAQFVASHPDAVDGLALWASYSASDLSRTDLAVACVYGALDAGADKITSPGSLANLPAGSRCTPIDGGNHEQFGDYTGQANDPPATIAREAQQAAAVEATATMLKVIEGR